MRESEGFDILHNGVPRTFRDQRAMAYEAARFAKTQNPADIIEIVDRSKGTKMVIALYPPKANMEWTVPDVR
jgi:hypothetical protein